MAVDLGKLVSKRKLSLEELRNRVVAIDAYNVFYQFLSIIRGPDGTPLMDSHGNVTSHLSGLFYRNIELIGYGVKPVYVFDGIPSTLKQRTINARIRHREEQKQAWEEAKKEGNLEEAKIRAQGSTRITKEIVESGKKLLQHMGIPCIMAPSEGEGQASYMCKNGLAYAVASQDYDTMLFGAPKVVRNMTLSGRRKLPSKNVYINIEPELMSLDDTLKELGINQKQLIWLGILLGTDFNEGIPKVGPKTALKITKEAKTIGDIKRYVKEKYNTEFELDISEVEDLFLKPEAKEISEGDLSVMLEAFPNKDEMIKFMCDQHDFSRERIEKFSDKLAEMRGEGKQKSIGQWFK